MGVIAELESLVNVLREILTALDNVPMNAELTAIKSKIESGLAVLKAVGL